MNRLQRTAALFAALTYTPLPTTAGPFGHDPIVGHCTNDRDAFTALVKSNGYILQQTSEARNDRTVLYFKASDYMVAVVDGREDRWCVQFSSESRSDFIAFLIGRYDPTTQGDEALD